MDLEDYLSIPLFLADLSLSELDYCVSNFSSKNFNYKYIFIISMIMSLLTFLSIGILRSMYDKLNTILIIFETLILGTIAASIAYIIGNLLDAFIL